MYLAVKKGNILVNILLLKMHRDLSFISPVPEQFDWDKIRTEMKPIKMARTKA